jgi:hypothetical protein
MILYRCHKSSKVSGITFTKPFFKFNSIILKTLTSLVNA